MSSMNQPRPSVCVCLHARGPVTAVTMLQRAVLHPFICTASISVRSEGKPLHACPSVWAVYLALLLICNWLRPKEACNNSRPVCGEKMQLSYKPPARHSTAIHQSSMNILDCFLKYVRSGMWGSRERSRGCFKPTMQMRSANCKSAPPEGV